jgi:hypothetical protein
MKIPHLLLALSSFASAIVILAFAEDAVGYALVVWNLAGTGVAIWFGRLWK